MTRSQVFFKVIRVIKSCVTLQQLLSADRMIELYNKKFNNYDDYRMLLDCSYEQGSKINTY